MSKLKKLYNTDGKLRVYREDENGREYFYYEDKETHLVIRAAIPIDKDIEKLHQIAESVPTSVLKNEVCKIGEYDEEGIFLIETKVGKLIAAADVSFVKIDKVDKVETNLSYYFKNMTLKTSYEENLKKALYNLCQKTRKYEHLYHATAVTREKIYDIYEDSTALRRCS